MVGVPLIPKPLIVSGLSTVRDAAAGKIAVRPKLGASGIVSGPSTGGSASGCAPPPPPPQAPITVSDTPRPVAQTSLVHMDRRAEQRRGQRALPPQPPVAQRCTRAERPDPYARPGSFAATLSLSRWLMLAACSCSPRRSPSQI